MGTATVPAQVPPALEQPIGFAGEEQAMKQSSLELSPSKTIWGHQLGMLQEMIKIVLGSN